MLSPPSFSRTLLGFLLFALTTSSVAAHTIVRRDPPAAVTQSTMGPYAFTAGVPGCVDGQGGSFSFTWVTNSTYENPFCGKGWSVGSNRTVSYSGTYTPNGNSKVTIYGWTRNPLISYQVMESFGSYNPAAYAIRKGLVSCNGRDYDVLAAQRINQPSIDGTQTFQEYWSVRRNMWRSSNTTVQQVDMNCHFKAWASFGMNLGTHYYQLVSVDAYYSSGSAMLTRRVNA